MERGPSARFSCAWSWAASVASPFAVALAATAVVASSACCVALRAPPDHAVCPIPRSQERAAMRAERDKTAREEPALGVVPDVASALNRTEVRVSGDVAASLDPPPGEPPDRTSWLFTEDVSARLSYKHATAYAAKGHAQQFLDVGDGMVPAWTTWRAGFGLRHVRGIDSNHVRGMALRVDGSYGADGAANLLEQRPTETMRFADGWTAQIVGEVRYELLGCFSPFIHWQLGARYGEEGGWGVPLGATFGAHREVGDEPIMIWGGYEVLGRRADSSGRAYEQRLRLGAEALSLGSAGVRLGASLELVLGPVDGTFATVTLTVPFDVRRRGGS